VKTVISNVRAFVGFAITGYACLMFFLLPSLASDPWKYVFARTMTTAGVAFVLGISMLTPDLRDVRLPTVGKFAGATLLLVHGGYWLVALNKAPTGTVVDFVAILVLISYAGALTIFWNAIKQSGGRA
jgi:hypothetical protein